MAMTLRSLTAALAVIFPAMAMAEDTITILHINDLHSRIEPISKYNNTCSAEDDAKGECFGGAARLVSAINAARQSTNNPVLLLDGGDQFQGSLFYTHYKGKAAAEIMNAIGFDVMAVGNHEFDDGPEVLADFVNAVEFPLVMANAEVADNSPIAGLIAPTVIVEAGENRYGIIGLTPQDNDTLASPGPTIKFTDPAEAVRREIEALKVAGVDRVIVLSHSGLAIDERIASEVSGIDLIVGGHSHTLLSNAIPDAAAPYPVMVERPDGTTPIVQAGSYGKYLGKIDVTFDDAGVVTDLAGDTGLIDASVPKDAAMDARIAELAKPLDEIRQEVVGEAAVVIDGSRETCRSQECTMGVLVADAMLDRVKDQGIQIAIQNGGGLRSSIEAGEVTMGDVLTVLPFQNTIATFQLTGEDVLAALESGVSKVEEGAGRFPQVSGLRYTLDLSVAPGEGRIKDVEVADGEGWAPLDPAATYGVVSNDYMRQGGDGYKVFAENATNAYDYGPSLEDVVAAYIGDHSPVEPELKGRITVKK